MSHPLLFISHKHSDSKIAKCIADFVREKSLNQVDVHVSSDPESEAPKLGKNINEQLRRALKSTEALILIYTIEDQDWSYCMWECGVATDPDSLNTNIIVLQCGNKAPSPFTDVLRVNARQPDGIRKFTNALLRDPEFFPDRKQAIAPDLTDKQIDKLANELFESLSPLLPTLEPNSEWSAWPHICIELPREVTIKLRQGEPVRSKEALMAEIRAQAIICSAERVPELFGMTHFPGSLSVGELVKKWQEKFPELTPGWFDSCCEQIYTALRGELPLIQLTPFRAVNGGAEYICVVNCVRDLPSKHKTQFEIHFYNMNDPRAIPVTTKMIGRTNFFSKNLAQTPAGEIRLLELLHELTHYNRNRIPVMDGEGHPLYMIHRSMIDQFLVTQFTEPVKSINELSLSDLLAEPAMKEMFASTFAIVGRNATLADARKAMREIRNCRDVFVTEKGSRGEPVIGWLTNIEMEDIP